MPTETSQTSAAPTLSASRTEIASAIDAGVAGCVDSVDVAGFNPTPLARAGFVQERAAGQTETTAPGVFVRELAAEERTANDGPTLNNSSRPRITFVRSSKACTVSLFRSNITYADAFAIVRASMEARGWSYDPSERGGIFEKDNIFTFAGGSTSAGQQYLSFGFKLFMKGG
ncbi:hypothetical protein FZX02_00565 [Synechococcus sp. MU1644]|nr:hypothetical protein [Synechococcus sp. MU1644]